MLALLRLKFSYSATGVDHPHLKSLLRHIHEAHPNVVSMCRILEPAAGSLIRNHRLSTDDNRDATFKELEQYL